VHARGACEQLRGTTRAQSAAILIKIALTRAAKWRVFVCECHWRERVIERERKSRLELLLHSASSVYSGGVGRNRENLLLSLYAWLQEVIGQSL